MAEAAALYKSAACSLNFKAQAFNAVWSSNSGDIVTLRAAAAAARDASSATATQLDQAKWPVDLQADINTVRDSDYANAAVLAQIASAPSWNDAARNTFPADDPGTTAGQRLRSRLGLPADPMAC
ncbi:hypothetical protein [Leifsonia sp. P73]|uniref:hypothetical protein n=1 Tax=Leifsonia sp. P73 TaxID=3423959 RepID=UPI003DA32BD4